MPLEQIVLLAIAGIGGIWAAVKILLPRLVDARIEERRDSREHSQTIELKRSTWAALQDSWRDDKIATLLEEESSFIRERVFAKLEEIDEKTYRHEMTLAQYRATQEANGRELYEINRRLRVIETKIRLLIELISGEKIVDEENGNS